MRVLYTTNLPAPYKVKFFEELGRYCDLTVVYERNSASDRNVKWTAQHENTFKEIYLDAKPIGGDNSFSFKLQGYLKHNSFDCIVIGMYSTYTAMAGISYLCHKRIPFLISTDGGFVKNENKLKYKLKKHFMGSADGWLSTGEESNKYLIHYGADVNRCYIYPFSSVVTSDIEKKPLGKSEKDSIREKLRMEEDYIVLSVGQFIYRKGYDILLRASLALKKNMGVYIVGGTPTEDYLSFQRNNNLSNVHFIDFKSKKELTEYYRAADIFVLPTREDVWGLVINEAMAHGLPVITTKRCQAGLEMIKSESTGIILDDPEDFESLSSAIMNAATNMGKFDREKILEIACNYTIEEMAKKNMMVINEFSQRVDK